ncbi:glycosyltransferase family protein [Geodermatophilus sp. SYSU D00703]
MRVLFMLERRADAGSIQAVANYIRTANRMGHSFALFGRPEPAFPDVTCSTDLRSFDHVVLVVESGLEWLDGLRAPRVLAEVPRHRRVVLDADGMFGPLTCVDGYDHNHRDEDERGRWTASLEALADRILQPRLPGSAGDAEAFPFYGYDPESARRRASDKTFDVLHVGHNWWRWREVSSILLPAIESIRDQIGDIGFIGSWWDAPPRWFRSADLQDAFDTDPEWFARLEIRIKPAVPYTDVVAAMGTARVNVMTQRPLFRRLRLLTSKYFEIFAADTVPLVLLDPDHAAAVYGAAGPDLTLHDDVGDKLLDALAQPQKYSELVDEVRDHLEHHHAYRHRVLQLVGLLGGWEGAG